MSLVLMYVEAFWIRRSARRKKVRDPELISRNGGIPMSEATEEKAVFGAGCFWGVEAAFRKIEGVTDVAVGYAGGKTESPTYEEVCTGLTGHAEVVEVVFDSSRVSYEDLLGVFWRCHDPTTLNRQGPDVGTQYRSAIYFSADEQQTLAERSRKEREAELGRPIVTQVAPLSTFWRAEEYHQNYFAKRGISAC